MSDSTPVEENYSYDGWLVFNDFYNTEIIGDGEVDVAEVVESFPTYEGGTPNDPDSGFRREELANNLVSLPELTPDLEAFSRDLQAFRYVDEDWVQEFGYDKEGNQKIYFKEDHDEIDLFWDAESQLMMFRGDKQLIKNKRSSLRAGLSDKLALHPIDFDFDFFLWVLYKEYEGEDLSTDLKIRELTRGKTISEHRDNLGRKTQVEGTEDLLRSIMLIAPVLAGKKIEGLQGNFILDKNIIKAEIQHGGKVHVKVSDSPLSRLSDLRRMGIGLRFLSELISLYNQWEELDVEDRYPEPSFFDELGDVAEAEGWDPLYDPTDIKDEYRRKRKSPSSSDGSTSGAEDAA